MAGRWRGLLLALLWVGPSWYFSLLIFAGNAGLIFPFLPLIYLAAARGLQAAPGPPTVVATRRRDAAPGIRQPGAIRRQPRYER